jgi:hypothetical protein
MLKMPSSVISFTRYYPDTSTLRVGFVSGMVYDYKNVPEKVYVSMKKAISKGSFLNRNIKDKYEFEKVG